MKTENETNKKRILIIDDAAEIRLILKIRLEMSGFSVIEGENGKKGIDSALKNLPDLIITDYSMPEMNGIEVVKFLKNNEEAKHIPIIMLSSFSFGNFQIEELRNEGLTDIIMKPYELEILFDLIYRLLMLNDMRDAIKEERDIERRRYTRFNTFNFASVEINGNRYKARIKNISKNGVTLVLPQTADIGSTVKIFFKKQDNEYIGTAKIIWIDKERMNEKFTAGLEVQKVLI